MGDLRPLGSEKLQGIDKIKRIMEIARYNEPTTFITEENNKLEYNKTISDGYTYGIVKEKSGYIIKRSLNESPMDYVDNIRSRKYYRSYSEALKRLNLIVKESNRLTGYEEEIPLIGEQKFVLKTKKAAPAAGTEPTAGGVEPPVGGMDIPPAAGNEPLPGMEGTEPAAGNEPLPGMEGTEPAAGNEPLPGMEGTEPAAGNEPLPGMEGTEPPVGGMEDTGMGDEEMGDEEMGPVGLKTIQKLTGRLSQKIRMFDKEKGLDSQDIKYVVNSILSAIDMTKLDDEDRDDILDKLEQYESYGEEGEGELDMGGMDTEEPGMDTEEPGMGMEEPEMGTQPPVAESKVERLLMKYFDVKKTEKPILEEKIKKEYLNQKIKTLKIKNEVINLSESKRQMDLSLSLLSENYKFVGKTNNENLLFTKNGKQVKVTPRGRII